MNEILTKINDFMYTYILLILLVGAGIYFSVSTKGVQIRLLKRESVLCTLLSLFRKE